MQRNPDGSVSQKKSPPRIDCAYIITAWNKTTASDDEDNELQEHRLLSQVLRVLLQNPSIPFEYLHGVLKGQEPDLPVVAAQQNGLPDAMEFWNALNSPARPSINCVITFSLDSDQWITGPMVITKITEYMQWGKPGAPEKIIQIGGRAVDTSDPAKGIDNAVLKIRELDKKTFTDSNGYYTFTSLPPGTFTVDIKAPGYKEKQVQLTVPAPAGSNYDIQLKKTSGGGTGPDPFNIPLSGIREIGDEFQRKLEAGGIDTIGKLLELSRDELAVVLQKGGTGPLEYYRAKAANILKAVDKYVSKK
jgi:hypothetical protein